MSSRLHGAHPRPCGEHGHPRNLRFAALGSSPPVRGARATSEHPEIIVGLIPARAGSTFITCRANVKWWAHPRPCGEHIGIVASEAAVPGSSPPVRGARLSPYLLGLRAGAHPRPCGEHADIMIGLAGMIGSSPPVRGALFHGEGGYGTPGLIPARAGSTACDS